MVCVCAASLLLRLKQCHFFEFFLGNRSKSVSKMQTTSFNNCCRLEKRCWNSNWANTETVKYTDNIELLFWGGRSGPDWNLMESRYAFIPFYCNLSVKAANMFTDIFAFKIVPSRTERNQALSKEASFWFEWIIESLKYAENAAVKIKIAQNSLNISFSRGPSPFNRSFKACFNHF